MSELGRLEFEVRDLGAWERFGTDVLGLGLAEKGRDFLLFQMDDHHHRIRVIGGPADDLARVSWEVPDAETLAALAGQLTAAGVVVEDGSSQLAAERRVAGLVRFTDPAGISSEITFGAERGEAFTSPLVHSGFVTGAQGMGHCVVASRSIAASRAFYCDVLGLRYSDRVHTEIHGHAVDITFLHANTRHHSIAFPAPPGRRIHHFLLEVGSLDDVGYAFDRACRAGVEIVLTLGRHPNDRMFSFYARTPSGFEFEVGWGGLQVDDATWEPRDHDRISAWGHIPPGLIPRRRGAP